MGGTIAGGIKARATNYKKYGKDFYREIGRKGGSRSTNGGFASQKVGKDGLTGQQRAQIAGKKGGLKSKRTGVRNGEGKKRKKVEDSNED